MIWKEITDFADYEINALGEVRRKAGLLHAASRSRIGKALKWTPTTKGYACVTLYRGGKPHFKLVHRLVAEAFIGPVPSPEHQAAHLNGKRMDNRTDNIVWATNAENNAMKIQHGTLPIGERNGAAILDKKSAMEVFQSKRPRKEIAAKYGIAEGTVYAVKNKQNWKHLHTEATPPEATT